MEKQRKGRVVERETCLITGASGGIGSAIALKMAEEGYNLVLHYGKNKEAAEKLAKEIKSKYPEAELLLLSADIRKEEEVNALVEEALSRFSSIEVLVNNAGVTRDQLLLKMTAEDFDCVIESNLRSAFLFSKAVSKYMIKKRYGRIVQISSVVGLHGNSGQCNYAASKAGLIGFSKSLAKELAGRNITVNVICPGFIDTKMTEVLSDAVKEALLSSIPMKKFGTGEDVANAVAFFAKRASSYITGESLLVDGGMGM